MVESEWNRRKQLITNIAKRAHASCRLPKPNEQDWCDFAEQLASIPTHEEAALYAKTRAGEHARWLEIKTTYLTASAGGCVSPGQILVQPDPTPAEMSRTLSQAAGVL